MSENLTETFILKLKKYLKLVINAKLFELNCVTDFAKWILYNFEAFDWIKVQVDEEKLFNKTIYDEIINIIYLDFIVINKIFVKNFTYSSIITVINTL